MPSHYRITVQPIDPASDPAGETATRPALSFPVSNHDDLLDILAKVRAAGSVPDGEAAEFVIGLKLFLEVLIRHRNEPLFADLWPEMGKFMKRLKAGPGPAADNG